MKTDFLDMPDKLADVIGKLKETGNRIGATRDEMVQVLMPEIGEFMADIERVDKERASEPKPKRWEDLEPDHRKELVFQYLLFYFCWTVADGTLPRKKIAEYEKAATSRIDAPARFRKEAAKASLKYLFAYLEEHERERFPGYKKFKKDQSTPIGKEAILRG